MTNLTAANVGKHGTITNVTTGSTLTGELVLVLGAVGTFYFCIEGTHLINSFDTCDWTFEPVTPPLPTKAGIYVVTNNTFSFRAGEVHTLSAAGVWRYIMSAEGAVMDGGTYGDLAATQGVIFAPATITPEATA